MTYFFKENGSLAQDLGFKTTFGLNSSLARIYDPLRVSGIQFDVPRAPPYGCTTQQTERLELMNTFAALLMHGIRKSTALKKCDNCATYIFKNANVMNRPFGHRDFNHCPQLRDHSFYLALFFFSRFF